jgi:hypothetical protein
MFKTKIWLAAATAIILGATVHSAEAGWRWFRSPRSYQRSAYQGSTYQRSDAPRATAAAPGNRQSVRRYSLSPSAGGYSTQPYSYSPPATLGLNRSYNPGPGYSPRQGINRADFKIKGL